MLPLVLLLAAADPSPSLAAIVALGKGNPPATPTEAAAHDAHGEAVHAETATTAAAHATTTTPAATPAPAPLLTKKDEPTAWPGIAAFVVLCGAAGFVLWKKKQTSTSARLLTLKDAVAVGKGRSLIVADVAGRRVLLSSSEAGIAMLLDLGMVPKGEAIDVDAINEKADADATDFAAALAEEVRLPTAASAGTSVDVEGSEIQRRLERARSAA